MVAEWLGTLATFGATALVGAAASEAWTSAKDSVIALFGRAGQRRHELAIRRGAAPSSYRRSERSRPPSLLRWFLGAAEQFSAPVGEACPQPDHVVGVGA